MKIRNWTFPVGSYFTEKLQFVWSILARINGLKPVTIFGNCSILRVWQGSEYNSEAPTYFQGKLFKINHKQGVSQEINKKSFSSYDLYWNKAWIYTLTKLQHFVSR